ncbi:hypothetical protein REIS_0494 [Rickettsia endosymbiont of Ixodes scapularis]|nr:hypothetical protein REIS_0494 [Rickettsia endosymbiont of Ixodes scapularis]
MTEVKLIHTTKPPRNDAADNSLLIFENPHRHGMKNGLAGLPKPSRILLFLLLALDI